MNTRANEISIKSKSEKEDDNILVRVPDEESKKVKNSGHIFAILFPELSHIF